MVVREYLEGFLEEILYRKKKTLSNFSLWYLGYGIAITIISIIGLKIIGIHHYGLKGILVGIFSLIPFLGTGIVFIPWVIARLVTSESLLSSQLAILYIILCIIKEIVFPFLIGKKFNIRPIIIALIFLICYTIGKEPGAVVACFLIFIMTSFFDAMDIQTFYRKNKARKRRYYQN
ncbi:AI-2E family transporter [Lagierella sp.]|uniref:AI-2E family transporter n=1 Tax=Lagierella sp. TaxID=2849657 RepID=UPI00262F08A1|nr:AI-2E family transporter [Lagierella sp.]